MIKKDGKKITIICDNCGANVIKEITGMNLLKMNAKLPDGWVFLGNKIFCNSDECQNYIKDMNKRKDNSKKIAQDNWTNTN